MRQKLFLVVVVFSVCLFSVKAQTVNESESSILFNETTADITLAIENPNQTFDGKISLELLDSNNVVRADLTQNAKIENGKKAYKLTLPLGDLMKKSETEIAWYRLRYRIGNAQGIISLSQIIRDIFELRVIASDNLFSGMTYRSRIRALSPFTQKAVEGVKVDADLELDLKSVDDQKLKLNASGKTDADGFAVLEFQIPVEAVFDGSGEIKVTGKKNGVMREAKDEVRVARDDFSFLMLTDKPIYQPEQMLEVRGILMKGSETKTVVAGSEVEFRIEDEDGTVLYREKVKTSAFGVASIAWKIPENAKLGNYRIRVKNQDQDEGYYVGSQQIKISRYDLPNFAVSAKALKPYYLPDEKQAEVEVSAKYLFGKPVTKGKVRVVRENDRTWNWKQQKYDIEEGESHDGDTDAEGKFTAKFDLSKDQDELKKNSRKFSDLSFTAYFTDLTTNRTEPRRFDVRVTRESIHVYLIGEVYNQNPNLPVTAYVSTFYADGSVAVCDVELKGREENISDKKYRTIQQIKTNSYGAGKLEFKRPKFEDKDHDELEIQLIAKDKSGKRGTFGVGEDDEKSIEFDDDAALKIEIPKTIFKPGEQIEVKVNSSLKTGLVYVDIVQGWSVIDSRFVNLSNGSASLKIPYQPNFKGELKIAAFLEDQDEDVVKATRGIIFPAQTNLKIDANFDKETYKPGEDAKINFGVFDSVGSAVESALGVVVFDTAIEERARTEGDFSGTFNSYRGWLGYGDSFGSVNVKDLNDLDLSKPIADELQLVAEVMLYDEYYQPNIFHSRSYYTDAKSVYAEYFFKQFVSFEKTLSAHYAKNNFEHPTDEQSFQKILRENNLNFDDLRDPWGEKYKAVFEFEKTNDILRIITAGADKIFGTKDDFAVSSGSFEYFRPIGKAIDGTFEKYHKRTGKFILDEKTLFAELGISEMKDRFGNPYQFKFEVSGRYYQLRVRSFGTDGKDCNCYWNDDFDIWSNKIDYFVETESAILKVLQTAKKFPMNEAEFKTVLRSGGIDFDDLRDGYGEKLYFTKQIVSRYADKTVIEKVQKDGEKTPTERTIVTPITQEFIVFTILGNGSDRRANSYDDVTFAQFSRVISEQSKTDKKPKTPKEQGIFIGETGSIEGTISDANGAVIPNASVTVKSTGSTNIFGKTTTADENGFYQVASVLPGIYVVSATAPNFKVSNQNITVSLYKITVADFSLETGSGSVNVEVTGGETKIDTNISKQLIEDLPSGTQFSSLLKVAPNVRPESLAGGFQIDGASGSENTFIVDGQEVTNFRSGQLNKNNELPSDNQSSENQKFTPKLREYFPETLLWSPELVTDQNGKASLIFKMADNITTWKLYTIASTKEGKIGVAEKEIAVFQPFFVDLDPPKFLTDGDEIFLPTQVRNYTTTKQKVDVTMAKADWFSLLSPDKQNIEVEKNAANNAVFGFKAITPVKDGKQRVTAIAAKESDAIEKPVTVRPNGQEIVRTESKLFRNSETFDIEFPQNALTKTTRAELKIYPNLIAHVTESVEGLLQRPYGCGEQTISSTYPNLMILKFTKTDNFLTKKARRYLKKGYERLLGYQIADGGFSYWGGKDSSDIALTAYALRFLTDAKSQIEVDPKVIENAQAFLVKQQRADGSFTKKYAWETTEDIARTKLFTSYVARTLAMLKTEKPVLDKALDYLKTRNAEIDEPYALALYALANFDAENADEAEKTVAKLQTLAKEENGALYWNLETNTPFYGWGTAGRIETTALVLQTLLKSKNQTPQTKEQISKATMFLLKTKDRYGVWYSTQTTINVLDAFLVSLSESKGQTISVSMNGEKLKEFTVSTEQIEPIILNFTGKLTTVNRLEITSSDDSTVMSQVVKTHYVDWKDAEISNRDVNDSRAIRLDYKCDKQQVKIMEAVNCSVEAERIGFKGYGMLLAEIGIPPGADVSRESLEKAFEADWSLSRYDILPDRIVVYMWSKAGGSRFNFSFKPRYGINAQTPASIIYDYYNEESKATIAPMKFLVK